MLTCNVFCSCFDGFRCSPRLCSDDFVAPPLALTNSSFVEVGAAASCQIQKGTRYEGDIITQTSGTDEAQCCNLCARTAGCTVAQVLAGGTSCYLFSGSSFKVVADNDWNALAPGGFPPSPSPTPPSPSPSPAPPGALVSRSGGRCLDLPGGDTSDGNPLWVWDCDGGDNQKWAWNGLQIQYDGTATWTHCVDVPGGSLDEGVQLQIWQCLGLPQQNWGYDSGEGSVYSYNSLSDASMCMRLADPNSNGAPVLLAGCGEDGLEWDVGAMGSFSDGAMQV